VQLHAGADRGANVARAVESIEAAARDGADLVVLPEFFNVEYVWARHDPSLIELAERDDGPSMTLVAEAARALRVNVVATLLELHSPGHYYDTAIVLDRRGEIAGKHRKVHPAATESLEKIFFRYGSHFHAVPLEGWLVGVNICYDNEFPESARCVALNGAHLLVAPFATPLQMPLRELLISRASDNALFVVAANKVGLEGGLDFCGTSMIIAPDGEVLAEASTSGDETIWADLRIEAVAEERNRRRLYRDRRPELYKAIVTATEDLPRPT
jgi:N-carbamoylputrescine amidase